MARPKFDNNTPVNVITDYGSIPWDSVNSRAVDYYGEGQRILDKALAENSMATPDAADVLAATAPTVKLPAGTAALPVITSESDLTSGIFFPTNYEMDVVVQGTKCCSFVSKGSNVNYLGIYPNIANYPVSIVAAGAASDIIIDISPKGSGAVTVGYNSSIYSAGALFRVNGAISCNQSTEAAPGLVDKDDAATGIYFPAPNQMSVSIGGKRQCHFAYTASAVNYVQITGAATGGNVDLSAQGSGTNIGITLTPKGSGNVYVTTGIELGHASDTTITRASAGVAAIEGSNILVASALDTDGTLAANSDSKIATQKATKTYTDGKLTTIAQNSQSGAYTTVLGDAGKHILHPAADTTARTWTIDSNANVAYPVGTTITFINQNGAGTITIAITSDTLRLAGTGGTGNRTLLANGIATAVKITTTEWIISGVGLS